MTRTADAVFCSVFARVVCVLSCSRIAHLKYRLVTEIVILYKCIGNGVGTGRKVVSVQLSNMKCSRDAEEKYQTSTKQTKIISSSQSEQLENCSS